MNRPFELALPIPGGTGPSPGSFADLAARRRDLSHSSASHATLVRRLEEALGGTATARTRLGRHFESLSSLTRETDPTLFFSSLNHLGQTLAREDRTSEALLAFSAVLESAPANLSAERQVAQRESDALNGIGAFGPRVEVLGRSFARQASHPVMLLSMGGAQVVFGGTRLALLSRLTSSPTAGLVTRGVGAEALASLGAFAMEGPAFVGIHRGLSSIVGHSSSAEGPGFGQELLGTYFTLGGLRLAGLAGNTAFREIHGVNRLTGQATRWAGLSRISQPFLHHGSTLGGIYLGRELEILTGLRRRTDGATTLTDSLATLAQFMVAGRLMHGAFGPEFARLNQEIQLRSELAAQSHLSASSFSRPGVQAMLNRVWKASPQAMESRALAAAVGLSSGALQPSFPDRMFMEGNSDGNGSIPPPSPRGNGSIPPPMGEGGGSIPPPRGPDSAPPPNGGRRRGLGPATKRWFLKNYPRFLKRLGRSFDWNRFTNPQQALHALHTGPLPLPPETIAQGIQIALGHTSREQLDSIANRTRRDLEYFQTHGLTGTRELYIQAEQARQRVQRGERELLAPILPIYRSLVEGLDARGRELDKKLENYENQAHEILGEKSDLLLADALIDLHWVERARQDAVFRSGINDADLEWMGYVPAASHRAADNYDIFVPGTIEGILDHNAYLGRAEGAAELREAARRHYYEARPLLLEARALVEKLRELAIERNELKEENADANADRIAEIGVQEKELNRKIGELEQQAREAADPTRKTLREEAKGLSEEVWELENERKGLEEENSEANAERIADLETQENTLKDRVKELERQAQEAPEPLKKALREFLSDPERARTWTLEMALQSSVRAWLHENPERALEAIVSKIETEGLSGEEWKALQARVHRLKQASLELGHQKIRTGIRGPVDALARIAGQRDYQELWQAMGEYEASVADLFVHHEPVLLPTAVRHLSQRLNLLPEGERKSLIVARETVRGDFSAMGRWAGERLAEMNPLVEEYYRYHDAEYRDLRQQGMQVGFRQVEELLEKIQSKVGEIQYRSRIAPEWEKLRDRFDSAVKDYLRADRLIRVGRLNPRDFNRKVEEPAKILLKQAYRLVEKEAKRARLGWGKIPPTVPMFENYMLASELVSHRSGWVRHAREARYLGSASRRMIQVFAAERYGYPYEMITRRFIDFGAAIGDGVNPQTFYVPNYLPRITRYFGTSRSDAHWTHLDFIGHSANSVQADHGELADLASSPDIIAKFDLQVPFIDQVFPLIVNFVSNDKGGVRASEVRASQMQSFGYPQAHPPRLRRRDFLNYDGITMPAATGRGPNVGEVHEPVNESWPAIGRVFHGNEGETVLTSRLSGITLGTNVGAIRNYPNQRGPFMLDNNPSSYTHLMIPANAFPEPNGTLGKSARVNLERMLWNLQANQPELNPPAPSTYELYEDFEQPRNLDVERQVARMFAGAEELYPTAKGIQTLEAQVDSLRGVVATGANSENPRTVSQAQRDLELTEKVLDVQTRRLLRRRLSEINLEIEAERKEPIRSPEAKGTRRLQRVVRARLKLLDQAEQKLARGEALSLTERRFVEKMGAVLAGRKNTAGLDREIEQLDYYYRLREQGIDIQDQLATIQGRYFAFVEAWNERRKNPENPEYNQLHISEAAEYSEYFHDYRRVAETVMNLRGITPRRWAGQIIPEMVFRREGNATVIEPQGWRSGTEFSRKEMWRFLWDDTIGIVTIGRQLKKFKLNPGLYLFLHQTGWGWRMLDRVQSRIRIENSENLREVANKPSILAPTHDTGAEFPTVPAVALDYGIRAFFMADKKFFDPFWTWREFSAFGAKIKIPLPTPPAFGTIRALLGPLEDYGHLPIDRSNRMAARQNMVDAGIFVREKENSIIIFPGGTRTPVKYNENGERYEGPFYSSRPGISKTMEESGAPILPLGLVNGGVIFPKQNKDAYFGLGAALGREYIFRFGTPFSREHLNRGEENLEAGALREALVTELNRQFHELTGREIGPPAPSKAKQKK